MCLYLLYIHTTGPLHMLLLLPGILLPLSRKHGFFQDTLTFLTQLYPSLYALLARTSHRFNFRLYN